MQETVLSLSVIIDGSSKLHHEAEQAFNTKAVNMFSPLEATRTIILNIKPAKKRRRDRQMLHLWCGNVERNSESWGCLNIWKNLHRTTVTHMCAKSKGDVILLWLQNQTAHHTSPQRRRSVTLNVTFSRRPPSFNKPLYTASSSKLLKCDTHSVKTHTLSALWAAALLWDKAGGVGGGGQQFTVVSTFQHPGAAG